MKDLPGKENTVDNAGFRRLLVFIAVISQFITLFPFAVVTEGATGSYVLWHYAAYYGAFAVFYACGRIAGLWVYGRVFSKRLRPIALFLSRAAVAIPIVGFIMTVAGAELSTGLYMYLLPGCVIVYYSGYMAVGKGYSDIYTRGWFAVFFVTAFVGTILLWFMGGDTFSDGITQLCVAFGMLIITSAVLTNQTNIDIQTRQRSGGRAVLPKGLRSYNASLILGVAVLAVGLCFFAKPIADILGAGILALIRLLLSLLRGKDDYTPDTGDYSGEGSPNDWSFGDSPWAQIINALFLAGLIFLFIRFRKQILKFFKELFAPLFREAEAVESVPFTDEIYDSAEKYDLLRQRRKTEKELYRRFRRETDPTAKFRAGYELFLIRLDTTPFPSVPSDTTTIHSDKGTKAFSSHVEDSIDDMVNVYNRVRYAETPPTEQELKALEQIVDRIIR